MIETRLKLWRSVGAAALAAGALGIVSCGPNGEAGEASGDAHQAGEAAIGETGGEAGEAAAGESGAEHGEAGVADAYAGTDGALRTALRLQHLKGFVFAAQRASEGNTGADAGVLVSQGLLEVYDPAADQFGSLNADAVRAAGLEALDGQPRPLVAQRLSAAIAAINQAQAPLNADAAQLTARMIEISTGLYTHVNGPDGVDPVEYQHSMGAALAARDALTRGEGVLRARNAARYDEALRELNRLIELWPTPSAPETPATLAQVSAQASRVRLALSSFL
ncbi:MAG: hypothetical protein AB7J28_03995 [Hyphomonadaceae bacterium]